MGAAGVGAATFVSCKICASNERGVKMGCVLLGWLIILYFGFCAVAGLITHGVTDSVWGYGATAAMGLLTVGAGKSEEKS